MMSYAEKYYIWLLQDSRETFLERVWLLQWSEDMELSMVLLSLL